MSRLWLGDRDYRMRLKRIRVVERSREARPVEFREREAPHVVDWTMSWEDQLEASRRIERVESVALDGATAGEERRSWWERLSRWVARVRGS